MLNFKLMNEINQILSNGVFQDDDEINIRKRSFEAIRLIQALLNGDKNTIAFKNEYLKFCGHDKIVGVAVAGHENDDLAMLLQILNACDKTLLEQILNEFGRDNKLGKIIEEKLKEKEKKVSLIDDSILMKCANEKSFYELLCDEMKKRI